MTDSVICCDCDRTPMLHVHESPFFYQRMAAGSTSGWQYKVTRWRDNFRPASFVERAAWSGDLAAARKVACHG